MTARLPEDLTPGITVIVRTYLGVGRITKSLDSLRAQTLDPTQFEILVIPNGPEDGTTELVRGYRDAHPQLDIRIVRAPTKGLGLSMNVGLAAARHEYVTVVDDDDQVSEEFLEALHERATPDTISHGFLANLEADGTGSPDFDTYVNRSLAQAPDEAVHPIAAPASMMFNVAKLVWTPYARAVRSRENLRFATDVLYWHELVNTFGLKLRVVPTQSHAVYYRSLRPGSVSRPEEAPWELAIEARLDAVEAIMPIASDPAQYLHKVAQKSITSQAIAMGRYLHEHPDEHSAVVAEIDRRGIDHTMFTQLNRRRARDLVTCYAFAPSNNTSALVAARRVRARGVCVDVVSHDMTGVHESDHAARTIIEPYIGNRKIVPGKPKFSQWSGMRDYTQVGMATIEEWEESRGTYRSVYSRAMWPASHVLAALYKVRHPETRWIAEFSDPLSHDVEGKLRRSGKRGDDELSHELEAALTASGHPALDEHSLLEWVEHLAYGLADEIVFTNANQQATMLGEINSPGLVTRVREHTVISAHPTLPPEFYQLSDVTYPLEPGKVHLAYFGAFYPTRGLTEVTNAIRALPSASRDRLRVHVFTKDPDDLRVALRKAGMDNSVVANHYVPYLDFLHLTTMFDCLLVNDARTADTHAVNPYLPSKISDYAGSGRPIWAVVEPGSIMSQREVEHRSELGDVDGALKVLLDLTS